MQAALPTGVADEVIFDLNTNALPAGCGTPWTRANYQIDDLRVE